MQGLLEVLRIIRKEGICKIVGHAMRAVRSDPGILRSATRYPLSRAKSATSTDTSTITRSGPKAFHPAFSAAKRSTIGFPVGA